MIRIVVGAKDRKLSVPTVDQFNSVTGGGVHGIVEGKKILIGKRALLADQKVQNLAALDDRADELQRQGRTVMYVAVDGEFAGLLVVSDPIRAVSPCL